MYSRGDYITPRRSAVKTYEARRRATSRLAMMRAPVRAAPARRNRAPRVKGAIAPFGGRQELKYLDTANATYACDTTGSVTALNLMAVGDDNNTRDGRQVTIKSIQGRGILRPQDTTTTFTLARVILVWDNAVNSGTIATIAQILTAASSKSFPLIDNAQRFTILYDRTYALGGVSDVATQTFAGSPTVQEFSVYKKMNSVVQYSGTTAAIGSIQNGGLLLVTIGDQGATNAADLSAAFRIRFTDS